MDVVILVQLQFRLITQKFINVLSDSLPQSYQIPLIIGGTQHSLFTCLLIYLHLENVRLCSIRVEIFLL